MSFQAKKRNFSPAPWCGGSLKTGAETCAATGHLLQRVNYIFNAGKVFWPVISFIAGVIMQKLRLRVLQYKRHGRGHLARCGQGYWVTPMHGAGALHGIVSLSQGPGLPGPDAV
jgi:hypothetical protein